MQQPLPFEELDAAAAEDRSRLRRAVAAVGGDLYLRVFCEMVLAFTERGRCYEASHRQLAAPPHGLLCSLGKARKTVEWAVGGRLVRAEANYAGATQLANRYWIDWDGVSRILRVGTGAPRMAADSVEGVVADDDGLSGDDDLAPRDERDVVAAATPRTHAMSAQGDATTAHPHVTTAHGGATTWHGSRERAAPSAPGAPACAPARFVSNTSYLKLNTNTPGPVPEPDPEFGNGATSRALARWLAESPILREAATRRLSPRQSEALVHGVFRPLAIEHLAERETGTLVNWFRGQLAAPCPVLDASEANLLLVLAAAIYSTSLAARDVRTTRVAVFVDCVKRRLWKAVPYVPDARKRLDAWIAWCQANGRGDELAAIWEAT